MANRRLGVIEQRRQLPDDDIAGRFVSVADRGNGPQLEFGIRRCICGHLWGKPNHPPCFCQVLKSESLRDDFFGPDAVAEQSSDGYCRELAGWCRTARRGAEIQTSVGCHAPKPRGRDHALGGAVLTDEDDHARHLRESVTVVSAWTEGYEQL
ncbi:MAG: hypothetical protein H0U86_11220 [Chloroflexi bacterium]|nr:hypothetical protein [Chloroflexota bacterium]